MIKVSVLIPAYNVEPYIHECMDSVLNQTLKDIEVICVDDASTDGTLRVLREYEKKDSRVRVLCHEVNKGQSCGRNLALFNASGEYVYMLDADDYIEQNALEQLYQICKEDELDLVGFETIQFFENETNKTDTASTAHSSEANNNKKKMPSKMISYTETEVLDGREALIYCMETESFSLSTPTFMMRRKWLIDNSLKVTEGILHEDVGYIFELIVRAQRVRFLPQKFFHRRVRNRSTMTGGFTARNIEGYIKSYLKSFETEDFLKPYMDSDERFNSAVKKWRRDIFGRIRQLYSSSEEKIYNEEGGNVPGEDSEEIRRIFEIVKLTEPGRASSRDLFGEKLSDNLAGRPIPIEDDSVIHSTKEYCNINEMYICGEGQYAARSAEILGAYDIVVKGVIVQSKEHNSFRGFPVYDINDDLDTDLPVLISVSHYTSGEYEEALKKRGFSEILWMGQ